MFGRGTIWFVLALSASFTITELQAKEISYAARYKAKYPAVADGSTIGIVNFNGRDGDNFADALASELQSAELDGMPLFQVKTIDSMNYKSTNDISKAEVATAIRTGQKLGVKTVFTGTISTATVNNIPYTQDESVCAESTGLFKCKRTETKKVPCNKFVGQYTVSARAIRVDSGSLIFAESVSSQGEFAICNGQLQGGVNIGSIFSSIFSKKTETSSTSSQQKVATPDALLAKLRKDVVVAIRQMVAPYNKNISVNLKEKPTGLSKPDAQQFSNAISFANAGRMDRACGIFETLSTGNYKNNVPLIYNLGVCQEVLLPDEPAAALDYYAKADQLLEKPDKLVSDAYIRMKNMVGQSRQIK